MESMWNMIIVVVDCETFYQRIETDKNDEIDETDKIDETGEIDEIEENDEIDKGSHHVPIVQFF